MTMHATTRALRFIVEVQREQGSVSYPGVAFNRDHSMSRAGNGRDSRNFDETAEDNFPSSASVQELTPSVESSVLPLRGLFKDKKEESMPARRATAISPI